MITLQSFLTPDPEICTEQALYGRLFGPAAYDQTSQSYHLARGGELNFDTYFNLFDLGTWGRQCQLDGLFAEISGQGKLGLRVFHAQEGRSWNVIHSDVITLSAGTPFVIDLSHLPEANADGTLHLTLLALDDAVEITGGRFATRSLPEALPELTISITTFKREEEVRRTIERLQAFLTTFAYGNKIRVQVVDNGQSAEIETKGHVTAFDNPNLGGAGGFARGLLEAEEAGSSHCLFMDDDASFHMENIARAYMFLALARDPKTALSGAMITNTHKWRMWENGAWFDGSCHPLFNGVDLRDPGAVIWMTHEGARSRKSTLYGGWWFFAFPIEQVRRHPFPFFVRGDDINFSLANDFHIHTLNGVVSFQDDFTEKESAQTLYLDLRNHLVQHLTVPEIERSALGTARVAIYFTLRSLLRLHYSTAAVQLMAWEDVMQGPQFFEDNIDMSARRARIKEMSADEAWYPVEESELSETRRGVATWPHHKRHRWGMLTLNGHLLPYGGESELVVDINTRALVIQAFGAAKVTYLSTSRDKAYTVTRSRRRFFALIWQMAKLTWAFRRDFNAIKGKYRDGYKTRTSKGFWQKTLGKA
ncbi:glycosyltransferase family 2 protein [Tritonibacter horizontis]|uniref:Galactofuranosyl transferase GlfT2 n=1 Tax=Tritonibacter horizontis TaxID=1768241 RepID=A0A132BYW2_9RHOB|nr:glycosyltransferase [Tritonibacter horizontis]KUP93549.1 galactofuranosyl transferase GlfT2 [Tritonibacter horizontis]